MIQNNPFTSNTFTSIWSKHFNQNKEERAFKCIPELRFIKSGHLSYWTNFGETLTKGIYYQLLTNSTFDFKKKVFLVYDVPDYFEVDNKATIMNLRLYTTKQYPGYLIYLSEFTDLTHYMAVTFSKSSRYKLNKYKKRLEQCFDMEYRMFFGDISKREYDQIFDDFKRLLEKRFDDKKIENNNLETLEWNFYKEVAYPMILEKKASLFVIYDSGKPIGVTLNYFSDTIVFDAITVFDIDYSKFHLGSVTIMKLIEWSIENGFEVFDFSKGYFEYKTRWSNKVYDFKYHIYYDSTSFRARFMAYGLKKYFDLKQYLREKNLNEKFHKLTYKLKNRNVGQAMTSNYAFIEISEHYDKDNFEKMDTKTIENTFLKSIVFEFLYLNNECMTDLKMYEANEGQIDYLFIGRTKQIGVSINK